MSNFTPLVKKEYEFEGDKVVVTFARMSRKDVLSTLPTARRLKEADEQGIESSNEDLMSMLDSMEEKCIKYVRSIEGLIDAEGNPIESETVFKEFYFTRLANEISRDLLSESVVREGNE